MSGITLARPAHRPIIEVIPATRTRDLIAIAAGAGFLAVASQIAIPLPFTPVPLSLGSFATLLTGLTLGARRGAASVSLFLILGLVGAPVFAGGTSGWQFASFGYLLGYLLAALVMGVVAGRYGTDRLRATVPAAIAGTLTIYLAGVTWMVLVSGMSLGQALTLGVAPFVLTDGLKILATAALVPAGWRVRRALTGR